MSQWLNRVLSPSIQAALNTTIPSLLTGLLSLLVAEIGRTTFCFLPPGPPAKVDDTGGFEEEAPPPKEAVLHPAPDTRLADIPMRPSPQANDDEGVGEGEGDGRQEEERGPSSSPSSCMSLFSGLSSISPSSGGHQQNRCPG